MSPSKPELMFAYWSDPLCIWALVAQAKLDCVLAEVGDRVNVDYHVVPVFGSVGWRFRAGPWARDGVVGRVDATRRIALEHGRDDVSGECWRRDCPTSSWAPGAALKAVWDMETAEIVASGSGATYQKRLRERFFVEERNIARRTVQLELAEELGLPRAALEQRLDDGSALAALWDDHQLKEELRIQGSPTYVFESGRAMLYGNFSYGILHATVLELLRGAELGATPC